MDNSNLQELRAKIDNLDKIIVVALQQRLQLAHQIAQVKKTANLPALDESRWQEVLDSKIKMAEKLKLNPELITSIYEAIHKETLKQEDLIINKD